MDTNSWLLFLLAVAAMLYISWLAIKGTVVSTVLEDALRSVLPDWEEDKKEGNTMSLGTYQYWRKRIRMYRLLIRLLPEHKQRGWSETLQQISQALELNWARRMIPKSLA